MAFSRVFSDPPSKSIFKTFAVMLLSILASLYFLHCLTDRCGTCIPTERRDTGPVEEFYASKLKDFGSMRIKRLFQKWTSTRPQVMRHNRLIHRLESVSEEDLSEMEADKHIFRENVQLSNSLDVDLETGGSYFDTSKLSWSFCACIQISARSERSRTSSTVTMTTDWTGTGKLTYDQ